MYTFASATPELDEVAVGDVIVSDGIQELVPYGFLRKSNWKEHRGEERCYYHN